MKKIILFIITFILMINFNNVHAAGYCQYEYDGAILTVYEASSGEISYELNNDILKNDPKPRTTMRGKDYNDTVNKEIDSFKTDIIANNFYKEGEFFCPSLEILKKYTLFKGGVIITFTSSSGNKEDGDEGYYATINPSQSGTYNRYCDYNFSYVTGSAGFTNKEKLRISMGKNGISLIVIDENGDSTSQLYFDELSNDELKQIFIKNGVFSCENIEVKDVKICESYDINTNLTFKHYYFSQTQGGAKCTYPYVTVGQASEIEKNVETGNYEPTPWIQGELDCEGFLAGNFGRLLKSAFNLIRFIVPILIIVLTIVDYIKAIISQDQKEINKATQKFIKRLIIGAILFVLPTLIELILSWADIPYGTCDIK